MFCRHFGFAADWENWGENDLSFSLSLQFFFLPPTLGKRFTSPKLSTVFLFQDGGLNIRWKYISTRPAKIRLHCRLNIVKVAVDPRGDNRVDPQTTLTMLRRNSLSITGQTHEKLTPVRFLQQQKGRGVKIKPKHEKNARQKYDKLQYFIQSEASNITSISHNLLIYVSVRLLTIKISQ